MRALAGDADVIDDQRLTIDVGVELIRIDARGIQLLLGEVRARTGVVVTMSPDANLSPAAPGGRTSNPSNRQAAQKRTHEVLLSTFAGVPYS